jgi:hypothetical protein
LFNKYGALSRVQKISTGITATFGLIATSFCDYSGSKFGKKSFPCRYDGIMPEQFSKIFFKTIGVVKDCLQSFSPNWHVAKRDISVMYNSGIISEDSFANDHDLLLTILIFAIDDQKDDDWTQFSRNRTGYAFKENETEVDDSPHGHPNEHSGRTRLTGYQVRRNLIPVGSLPPLKQTGLYEKGDCYQ